MNSTVKKIILGLALVALNLFLWLYFDLGSLLTFEMLKTQKDLLACIIQQHYWQAFVIYILVYAIEAALFLPFTALLIIAGGFLFGVFPTIFAAMVGASCGGTCAALVTRYLIGKTIQERYREKLVEFNAQMERHGTLYLLAIRLIPIMPFAVANILIGLTLIPLVKCLWTTALGVIPVVTVYACIGQELTKFNQLSDIFTPQLIIAFTILALLTLVPILVRYRNVWRRKISK